MADQRSFQHRIDSLIESVGAGSITAGVEVNQPYAQNQHQTDSFRHPHGGRSHYLGGPLLENAFVLVEGLARGAITPFGSMIQERMVDIAETMAKYVLVNAPKETGQLSLSARPWVKSNGVVTYERPPLAPREPD